MIDGGVTVDNDIGNLYQYFIVSASLIHRTHSQQEVSSAYLEKMSGDFENYPGRSKDLFATRGRQIFGCGDWQKDKRLGVEEFAEMLWADQYPVVDVVKTPEDIQEEGVDQKGT